MQLDRPICWANWSDELGPVQLLEQLIRLVMLSSLEQAQLLEQLLYVQS